VKDQHTLIKGYRDLSQGEIARVNHLKKMAMELAPVLQELSAAAKADGDRAAGRYASLARTHLEQGFMFAIKAVARPTDDLGAIDL
jgi:hypothetical protein